MAKQGDSNAITRDYFDSILMEMRHIDGIKPDTSYQLYGETFATPIMTAALSHLNGVHENGLAEMGAGARIAGAVHWCGMGGKKELESIIKSGAHTIKIIKPYEDNQVILDRIAHAQSCGAFAVGMDIDHAFTSEGLYDEIEGKAMRPKSMDELRTFVEAADLPFIVKGVLSVQDAKKCLDIGVKGIVVSHHHGIMDYAVPPLKILPRIVDTIKGQIPVFVDCGVESGIDAYKALALGADAVCIGRGLMPPLKKGGAQLVAETIKDYTRQLAGVMARTGCGELKDIQSDILHKSPEENLHLLDIQYNSE